jgi:putative nucleotidyltransferase with HDIG domain
MTITTLSEERLIATAKLLPAAPQIMAKLHKMLLDSNSGMTQIAALLKRDIALTTRIIQVANSPAYNGGGLGTIEEALQRVGFCEVFRLVGVVASATMTDSRLRCYGYEAEAFRSHSLCTALVSEGIAKQTGMDSRLAYTAGLLRGIGCVLLDRIGRDQLGISETYPEAGHGHLIEWERQTFGLSHYDVAAVLLREWDFPEAVVKAVGQDAALDEPQTPLGKNLNLTQCLVNVAGFGLSGESGEWGVSTEKLAAVGLSMDEATRIREQAVIALRTFQT